MSDVLRSVAEIHDSLQRLTGLHRELLDACVLEREALVQAELKAIQDSTIRKQGVIERIKAAEGERLKRLAALAVTWKRPLRELSLPEVIERAQPHDPRGAERLRTAYAALRLLIERIVEANDSNRRLVERSLEHVAAMKKNVLGETTPKSNTYNPQGQRQSAAPGARLFSKDA